jgi:hypothetical protein
LTAGRTWGLEGDNGMRNNSQEEVRRYTISIAAELAKSTSKRSDTTNGSDWLNRLEARVKYDIFRPMI